MGVWLEQVDGGFRVECDGEPRVLVDDVALTVWGERHALARGGLDLGAVSIQPSTDEIGRYDRHSFSYTTRSLRQPTAFRLEARVYKPQPVVVFELLPAVGQPVFGQEEVASLRLGALPGCERGVFVHQRVDEYGRDAVGAWWAQNRHLPDPTHDNPFDWGLFAAWQTSAGQCAALVPLRGGGAVTRLRGESDGPGRDGLSLVASGWCGKHVYPRLPLGLLAFASTPNAALDLALDSAAKVSEWSFRVRTEKRFPEPFEWLGYATWGAFRHQPEEEAVAEALLALRQADVPVRWLLLEEGWQPSDVAGRLTGFGADHSRFPSGLRGAIQRFQGAAALRQVGAWVTAQGHWAGIDPYVPELSSDRGFTGTDGSLVPAPTDQGREFVQEWFDTLSQSGLDFLRVDNLGSARNLYLGKLPLDDAVGGTVTNLERCAAAAGLDLTAGMAVDPAVYNHFAAFNVMRVSADLHPSDKRATKLHLAHSVGVGAWLSRLAWPDYDAFGTLHPAARALAVFAALSGGPVALCDRAHQTDAVLARRLCLDDGRLLLPAAPGELPDHWFFADPLAGEAPLALCARPSCLPREDRVGLSTPAYPPPPALFLGLANVRLDGEPLDVTICPCDLPVAPADDYAVNLHFADERYVLHGDEPITLELPELGAELITITPVVQGQALVGMVHKLLGATGCHWGDDQVVSLPELGAVLLFDESGRVPASMDYAPYTVLEEPLPLQPRQAWRAGPWLLAFADSALLRLIHPG